VPDALGEDDRADQAGIRLAVRLNRDGLLLMVDTVAVPKFRSLQCGSGLVGLAFANASEGVAHVDRQSHRD